MKTLIKVFWLSSIAFPSLLVSSERIDKPLEGFLSGPTQRRFAELMGNTNPSDKTNPFGQVGTLYQLPALPEQTGQATDKGYWPLDRRSDTEFLMDAIMSGSYVATHRAKEATIGNINTNVVTALIETFEKNSSAREDARNRLTIEQREALVKDAGPLHLLLLAMNKASAGKTTKIDPTALESLDRQLENQRKAVLCLFRKQFEESFAQYSLLLQLQQATRSVHFGASKLPNVPQFNSEKEAKGHFLKSAIQPDAKDSKKE